MSGARAFTVLRYKVRGNPDVANEVRQLGKSLTHMRLRAANVPYAPDHHGDDANTIVVDHGTLFIEGRPV